MSDLATEYDSLPGREAHDTALTTELLRHLLAALLLRIARLPHPGDHDPTAGGETFRAFQRELEASFAVNRNAHDYAARIGYSSRTLTRACLAATGRTAKELIDLRVALEAKRLLAHTRLPVAAIGRMLGFTEPTNFGKYFTRATGHTPGEFRAAQHRA
ncbi:AraC-like DNA-binding protein [Kitasatospora sp. MAP12-15]